MAWISEVGDCLPRCRCDAPLRSAPGLLESRRLTVFSARVPVGLQEGTSSHTRADGKVTTARDLDIDMITANLDLGRAWYTYQALAPSICPISSEAERTFSCLSRLRSKLCRNLHIHLKACVRESQAKTLGAGFANKEFFDEKIFMWDGAKIMRQRPLGLATGPRTQKIPDWRSRARPSWLPPNMLSLRC